MSKCRESNLPCINVKCVSKALHAGLMAVLMAALMVRCWWLHCVMQCSVGRVRCRTRWRYSIDGAVLMTVPRYVLFHTAARAHCRTIVLQNMKNFQWMKRPNDCVQNLCLRISQWFSFGGHLSGKHTEKSARLSSKWGSINHSSNTFGGQCRTVEICVHASARSWCARALAVFTEEVRPKKLLRPKIRRECKKFAKTKQSQKQKQDLWNASCGNDKHCI